MLPSQPLGAAASCIDRRAVVAPRGLAPPQFLGPAWLIVHAQLAASLRIKPAALATDAGEKNEPAGGVAESIGSLDDLIQLAEGLRLGVIHASSAGRECSPSCRDYHRSRVRLQCFGQRRQSCRYGYSVRREKSRCAA
jgi:hypothetical protein